MESFYQHGLRKVDTYSANMAVFFNSQDKNMALRYLQQKMRKYNCGEITMRVNPKRTKWEKENEKRGQKTEKH